MITETKRSGLLGLGRVERSFRTEMPETYWPPIFRQIPEEPVKSQTIENQVTIVVLQTVTMFVVALLAVTAYEIAAWLWAIGGWQFNIVFVAIITLSLVMSFAILRLHQAGWQVRDIDRPRLYLDLALISLSVILLWLLDRLASLEMAWYRRVAAMLALNVCFALAASVPWLWRRMRREVDDPSWNPGPLARAALDWVDQMRPEIPEPPTVYRLEVVNDSEQKIVYEDLPDGVDFYKLALFIAGARHTGTAREQWVGVNKLFTREQYSAIRELFIRHGWARWSTPNVKQHGWVLTHSSRVLLKALQAWREDGVMPMLGSESQDEEKIEA